jgi:hypothetical protein
VVPQEKTSSAITAQPAPQPHLVEPALSHVIPSPAAAGRGTPSKSPEGWPGEAAINVTGPSHQFQIIGILNKLYVLMENQDGLVLVDQHAAHERILFEELRRRMEEQGVPSQRLLLAQTFELAPRDAEWGGAQRGYPPKMGIGIRHFGQNALKSTPPDIFEVSDRFLSCAKLSTASRARAMETHPCGWGRHDRENGLPACGQGQRSTGLPGGRKTDQRFARMRLALLLSTWAADHDSDLADGAGEKFGRKT